MLTVTLIGSRKFEALFKEASKELTIRGMIVMGCSFYPSDGLEEATEEQKIILDQVHKHKIMVSDIVYLVSSEYIGVSTSDEIRYSNINGVPVICGDTLKEYDRTLHWDKVAIMICEALRSRERPVVYSESLRQPEDQLSKTFN